MCPRGTQVVLCCAHGLMDNGWWSESHLGAKDVDEAGSTTGWNLWLEEARLQCSLTSLCSLNGCFGKVCLICVNINEAWRRGWQQVQFLNQFYHLSHNVYENKSDTCGFSSFRKRDLPVKWARQSSKRQSRNNTIPGSPKPELQQQRVSPQCFSVPLLKSFLSHSPLLRRLTMACCCLVGRAFSWSVSVPGGKRILLEFLKFDLESHPLCQSDHLTVFAGGSLPIGENLRRGRLRVNLAKPIYDILENYRKPTWKSSVEALVLMGLVYH